MKTTLITNVLNEEFFITPFLRHHRHLFDHGIIIDYGCTDKTIEIAKKIVPKWDIVSPKVPRFHGHGDVENIHHVEKDVVGWKMALNVTEFIFTHDLKSILEEFENSFPHGVGLRTDGICCVDKIEDTNKFNPEIPLLLQKTNGYFETDLIKKPTNELGDHLKNKKNFILTNVDGRSRLIHKANISLFNQGRHTSRLSYIYPRNIDTCPESPLMLCWFGYAPWDFIKNRPGRRYNWVDAKRENGFYLDESKMSYNLQNVSKYKEQLEKYRDFIKDIY